MLFYVSVECSLKWTERTLVFVTDFASAAASKKLQIMTSSPEKAIYEESIKMSVKFAVPELFDRLTSLQRTKRAAVGAFRNSA